jgi:DNA polymerase IV
MILHVDMDAFYASVEIRDNPGLAGLPVIVGGTPEGRGVVCAASYEARKYGVHSAQPAATALRLCPQAVVIRPRMSYYAEVSHQIFEILLRYTPLVEPLSLDEAFLDVSGSEPLFGTAPQIARKIKDDVSREVGLIASVGVAPNKFLAKIASDLEKPDALVVVDPAKVQEFLDPLPVGRLWGVGRVTGGVFERLGIRTIAQVRQMPVEVRREHFGQFGEHLWDLTHGRDDRRVIPDREAKSISHETTFAIDIEDMDVLRARLLELTELVGARLRPLNLKGRTVQLKLRYANFETITRSVTLDHPTDVTQEIWQAASMMLRDRLPKRRLSVRLIGVGVHGFEAAVAEQRTLFPTDIEKPKAGIDSVTDQIRAKFGSGALKRGMFLDQPDK